MTAQLMAARKTVTAATPATAAQNAIAVPNATIALNAKKPIQAAKTALVMVQAVITPLQKKKKRFITAAGAINLQ